MTKRRAIWGLLWLTLAGLGLIILGARSARHTYLSRGIPAQSAQPIAHGGVTLGTNVRLDLTPPDALDSTLSAIASSNILTVKQPFYYSPTFDWAAADRIISAVQRHGLTVVPLLDGDPTDNFSPPNLINFQVWAGNFARRYGEQIDHYIIWDEPNLTSHWGNQKVNADEYAALLNATGSAIRQVDLTAAIVAAPLAPTVEEDTLNMADPLYLQKLYEAGANFDIAAAKPYGFDHPPSDRTARLNRLNFSRAILLRDVMVANGDAHKALWAGNWGWNALPESWQGDDSIWGETTLQQKHDWSLEALQRAHAEWPWMGMMFVETWQSFSAETNPYRGFTIANTPLAAALGNTIPRDNIAYSGFHLAEPTGDGQTYWGDWRFSPEFGADASEKVVENGDVRDSLVLQFYGTDIALVVRRANFRARFYVTIDGQPANARPSDEFGTMVVLDAPNSDADYRTTELVATGLTPGPHTLELIAHRGWDQWALYGFSVGQQPAAPSSAITWLLWGLIAFSGVMATRLLAVRDGVFWHNVWRFFFGRFSTLSTQLQLALFGAVAAIMTATGLMTWSHSAESIYRRLGDWPQLALTAAAASIFYITPSFFIYIAALALLILLISFRPAWGVALVALTLPLYAREAYYKPVLGYNFSLTEIAIWAALVGFTLSLIIAQIKAAQDPSPSASPNTLLATAAVGMTLFFFVFEQFNVVPGGWRLALIMPFLVGGFLYAVVDRWHSADTIVLAFLTIATLSLFFTNRLDVAKNEWWNVVVEPIYFYAILRGVRPSKTEAWHILDAFVLSGVLVAVYGFAQILFGFNDLIETEAGVLRMQSLYGSPNNVALLIGRILPLLIAVTLFGAGRRRFAYGVFAVICGIAMLLTLSKGGLILGLPIALLILLAAWVGRIGRNSLPYIIAAIAIGLLAFLGASQIPQLATRLDLFGSTSFVRFNLWRASLSIISEHPVIGVGLDNFLYAHRGRYIFDAQWREPALNHPHNLFFDFATRLGLLGLAASVAMFGLLGKLLLTARRTLPTNSPLQPIAIGLLAGFGHMVAHGMVDHSFFLVDLALSFFLYFAIAVWLHNQAKTHL